MPELAATAKNVIIGLMIITGAMNTMGKISLIQHTDIKTDNWYMKVHITNCSSILICKPPLCSLDKLYVIFYS